MHDATGMLQQHPEYKPSETLDNLLYADDTLLIHASQDVLHYFMCCVEDAGKHYGLCLNWSKIEVMPVRCECALVAPDGTPIKQVSKMKYLGSMLCSQGRIGTELSCRLGAARSDFKTLCKVWAHTSLSRTRKMEVFNACIVSKVMYCLESAWLNKSERQKLDAFQSDCLRRIAGIKPSYVSRVSNNAVREILGAQPRSHRLLEHQLLFLGRIAKADQDNALRKLIFERGSIDLNWLVSRGLAEEADHANTGQTKCIRLLLE